MDRVDAVMEKLTSRRYENGGELVDWLREKVADMAFEEIAAMEMPGTSDKENTGGRGI